VFLFILLAAFELISSPASHYLDAVLICGGGQTSDGDVPSQVKARLDRGAYIYEQQVQNGGPPPALLVLSVGTVHKPPPLDSRGFPITECGSMANYLIKEKNIKPGHVFLESVSLDTIGNAFFARVIHTDPRQWLHLAVVTSKFHMPRTRSIFQWIFSLKGGKRNQPRYRLVFEEVPDVGMEQQALSHRLSREEQSLKKWEDQKRSLTSISSFHEWIYTQHSAYNSDFRKKTFDKLDANTLKSY